MLENWGEQIDPEFSKPVHKRQQIRLTLLFTFLMSASQPSSVTMVILLLIIC